jgi:hypothetical protein
MTATNTANNKLVRHRERMRAAGLRPVQFWVPDTRAPEFVALVRAQCISLAEDPAEAEALAFSEWAASQVDSWQ